MHPLVNELWNIYEIKLISVLKHWIETNLWMVTFTNMDLLVKISQTITYALNIKITILRNTWNAKKN